MNMSANMFIVRRQGVTKRAKWQYIILIA
eukprot:COSAG06_NODE_4538_length_4166_cov_2.802803_1_plen_28_part_10